MFGVPFLLKITDVSNILHLTFRIRAVLEGVHYSPFVYGSCLVQGERLSKIMERIQALLEISDRDFEKVVEPTMKVLLVNINCVECVLYIVSDIFSYSVEICHCSNNSTGPVSIRR